MTYPHGVIWLDHWHATIVEFSADTSRTSTLWSNFAEGKLHRKSGRMGSGRMPDDLQFFARIVDSVEAAEILVVGPGTAKSAFERYVHDRHPQFAARIVGVETLDHPSAGQLLAHARKSFRRIDQLIGDAPHVR